MSNPVILAVTTIDAISNNISVIIDNTITNINSSSSMGHDNSSTTTAPPSLLPVSYVRPPDLVSQQVADDFTEAVYCYLLPLLVVFGTVGNVMSIIVLCVEKKRDTTNMSLTALAISDTAYILTTFARQASCIVGKYDATMARNYTTLMYGQMIVVNICLARVTAVITAIISTERCIAVIVPLKVRDIITPLRMGVALAAAYIVTFALIGPVFFMGESYWVTNPRTNTSYVTYALTDWYIANKDFADAYRDIFLNAVFRLFPAILVTINTVAIIVRLKKSSVWRGDSKSQASQNRAAREKKLTRMLVTLCVIYLLCTLPGLAFTICTYITDEFSVFGRYRHTYKLTTAVSLLTQFINSSINFVIYMGMNERFANTYYKLFGCKKCIKSSGKDEKDTTKHVTEKATRTTNISKTELSESEMSKTEMPKAD